jgi:hypothetical protein
MNKQERGNYLTRFNGLNLTEEQLEQQWRARQEEEEYLAIAESMNARMAAQAIQTGGGAASGSVASENLPSGCIEFVVDTTDGTDFYFSFNTTGPINFTVDWGDGTTHDDSGYGGSYSETHEYPESDTQYTVRVCFDDASSVTELNFENN